MTTTERAQALRLAAETGADERTCTRWLAGANVKGRALTERLERAARKLRLTRKEAPCTTRPT